MANGTPSNPSKISQELLEEYRSKLAHDVSPFSEIELRDRQELSTMYQLELKQAKQILELRKSWSNTFKGTLIAIIAFEILVALFVGLGWLHFENEWFLEVIVLGGFANILTMPYLITKFLFSDQSIISGRRN